MTSRLARSALEYADVHLGDLSGSIVGDAEDAHDPAAAGRSRRRPLERRHQDPDAVVGDCCSQTRAIIDTALAKKGYTPRIAAEGGNPAVLARLAALMGGWTVLPKVVAEETATTITRHHQIAERPIVIATRRESPPDELRDGFVRQLLR